MYNIYRLHVAFSLRVLFIYALVALFRRARDFLKIALDVIYICHENERKENAFMLPMSNIFVYHNYQFVHKCRTVLAVVRHCHITEVYNNQLIVAFVLLNAKIIHSTKKKKITHLTLSTCTTFVSSKVNSHFSSHSHMKYKKPSKGVSFARRKSLLRLHVYTYFFLSISFSLFRNTHV